MKPPMKYRLKSGRTLRSTQHTQDYWRERHDIPAIDLKGEEFRYD